MVEGMEGAISSGSQPPTLSAKRCRAPPRTWQRESPGEPSRGRVDEHRASSTFLYLLAEEDTLPAIVPYHRVAAWVRPMQRSYSQATCPWSACLPPSGAWVASPQMHPTPASHGGWFLLSPRPRTFEVYLKEGGVHLVDPIQGSAPLDLCPAPVAKGSPAGFESFESW